MNKYIIYKESNRSHGCVAVEFTAIAADEAQVLELAAGQGVSLEGYTIEAERLNLRDPLGRPYAPQFRQEWN